MAAAWRLALSLVTLRNEINAAAPRRSRGSDGSIGNLEHQARCSRHNPNRDGVVTAIDVTHDPAGGMDVHALADRLVADPHPQLAYVISRGRIASRATGWRWHAYTGSNPHNVHAHFAVGTGPDCDPVGPYDSTAPWGLTEEDDMFNADTLLAALNDPRVEARLRQMTQAELDEATTMGNLSFSASFRNLVEIARALVNKFNALSAQDPVDIDVDEAELAGLMLPHLLEVLAPEQLAQAIPASVRAELARALAE